MSSIGDRLRAARDRLFVGREEEIEQFRTALRAETRPFNVLHVFGPGGVGKTELLLAFERVCRAHDVPAQYVDLRDVSPNPDAFRAALPGGIDPEADEGSILQDVGEEGSCAVLLLDSVDTVAALGDWLRSTFLPDLPENVIVVMAGRSEPAAEWRADPGWRPLVETLPLRNFDDEAGRALLDRRDVPDDQHETILRFTHGHPLATALVADLMEQRDEATFAPDRAPNVVKTVLARFIQEVPGPAHRATLEAASLVPNITEAVLRFLLEKPDAHDLFEWLRTLSFVRPSERGVVLHDLAREAIEADLRWRNPEWHETLHRRARQFYMNRLKDAPDRIVPDALSDFTFLLRDHPLIEPFYSRLQSQWSEADGLMEDTPSEEDWPNLLDMVADHEGDASARLAEHWFERQPQGVRVYRDSSGDPAGFMLTLQLDAISDEARGVDPVVEAASQYLEAKAPLRSDERASLFRFWMARDQYQRVSPVQSLIFIRQVRHYLQTPHLAYTFIVCRDAEVWDPLFTYADMDALPNDDVTVGAHTYTLYGHDWRARPPAQWLDRLAEQGFDRGDAAGREESQVLVLSRSDFEQALRDAMKNLHRADQLRDNPLLFSRFVTHAAGRDADEAERSDVLCTRLVETVEQLSADPRDEKYYRAVRRTYVQPAPTQEKAAEQLGVPFSTFRRHLNRGLDRVTDLLWEEEVGAL